MKAAAKQPQTSAVQPATERIENRAASLVDNRPGTVQARALAETITDSPRLVAQRQLVEAIHHSSRQVAQRAVAPAPNRTGLPDKLKAGVENLSGHSLDDVRVHYNSDKPAQLQAHAYAQGSEIHLAPGQEKQLPHEAWHVVQQKQGRVRATTQLKGVEVNEDSGLEREADVMGGIAVNYELPGNKKNARDGLPLPKHTTQLMEDEQKKEHQETTSQSIETLIEKSKERFKYIKSHYLPVDSAHKFLENRVESIYSNFLAIETEYDLKKTSSRVVKRLTARLGSEYALLSETEKSLAALYYEQTKSVEEVKPNGTLLETLKGHFEKYSRLKRFVPFISVRNLIRNSPPDQIAAAAADEEMLAAAARCMAPPDDWIPYPERVPNEFPEFVRMLNVRQKGKVTPHNLSGVDAMLRHVLGDWVQNAASRGVSLEASTVILKRGLLKEVQKKYAAALPGGGQVNAFTEEGTIFLEANSGDSSTIIHESIHLYADGHFKKIFGDNLDEGVTEYFARKVAVALNYKRDKYPEYYSAAIQLVSYFSEPPVARAYFKGDFTEIKTMFTSFQKRKGAKKQANIEDNWNAFLQKLHNKDLDGAMGYLGKSTVQEPT